MERPKGYPTSAGPCITLLQERFKQLKRQREQREEKQVLDSNSGCNNSNKRVMKKKQNSSETTGFSLLKDDLIFPTAKSSSCVDDDDDDEEEDDPLSLGLNNFSSKNMESYRDVRKNKSLLWQKADNKSVMKSDYNKRRGGVNKFEIRELDTSLHL